MSWIRCASALLMALSLVSLSSAQPMSFAKGPSGQLSGTFPNSAILMVASGPLSRTGIEDIVVGLGTYPPLPAAKVPLVVLAPQPDGTVIDISARFGSPTPAFFQPRDIVIADINGDGKPDIFVAATGYDAAPFAGETNGLLLSQPGASWRDASSELPTIPDYSHSAVVGDINADGNVDVCVINLFGSQGVAPYCLLGGNGGQSLTPGGVLPPDVVMPGSGYTTSLLVDVDNDGHPDLVLGSGTPSLSSMVLFNDGSGDFTKRPARYLPPGLFGSNTISVNLAIIDINQDGYTDLLVSQTQSSPFYVGGAIQVLVNDQHGGFVDTTSTYVPNAVDQQGRWYQFIRVLDLNGDGIPDFYAQGLLGGSATKPQVFAWVSDGTGQFKRVDVSSTGNTIPYWATFTDLDNDGRPDLVMVSRDSSGKLLYQTYFNTTPLPAMQPVPGTAFIVNNPYGPMTVQGAAITGNTISNFTQATAIQLGSIAGASGSYVELDFQGLSLGAGNMLTVTSGAPGQTVVLRNLNAIGTVIGGVLKALSGNGAPPPVVALENPRGITLVAGGTVASPTGLSLNALAFSSVSLGQSIVNEGTIDGGPDLRMRAGAIHGGGRFIGDHTLVSVFGNANNPVNGAHYLLNGLQLYPSNGNGVDLTLNAYGPTFQVLNLMINGRGTVSMPSTWPNGVTLRTNNAVIPPGGSRAAGAPEPSYGGGSMIVQASGDLKVAGGSTNDYVFPGAIVLKAGGTLDLNGVVIDQGWTLTGQPFQGVFFESPNIVSPAGAIQVLTNNPNYVNFSTFPHQHVKAWSLTSDASGGARFISSDLFSTHLNTYSVTTEAGANGECWVCLVNTNWVDMR